MQAWARLTGHPNVVRYYGAWIEPHDRGEHMYIQLEKCGPSLTQRSQLDGDFLEPELVEILRQVRKETCKKKPSSFCLQS